MNCYLSRNYRNINEAGNKAKTDIEHIMREMGFQNVGFRQTSYKNVVIGFLITLAGVIKASFCLRRGDILFLQYPLKKYFAFVCNMAHLHGARVVTVIHDLGSFRRQKLTIEQERRRLDHADYIITHNTAMQRWLEEHGSKAKLGTLKIFDYLSDGRAQGCAPTDTDNGCPQKTYTILYAGGLSPRKNPFLYDWINDMLKADCSYGVNLYGAGFETDRIGAGRQLRYMGFVKSDQLIATAQGDFGLVWDGISTDSCTGNWGEYLKYNNPHKTSLYLRCGLPVIIWSKAALADFITQNNAGFCVDSLQQIDEKLRSLTESEYTEMCSNAARICRQISTGYYFRTAAAEAVEFFHAKA